VRDFPVHIDFLRLSAGQAIKVVVPVHVVGQEKSPGVKRGGTLQIVEHSVELLVPSDAIPDYVEASVANLDIGSSVHLSDITLPNGAKATSAENVTLVTVVAPSGMTEDTGAAAEGAAA
jgi:large subunit ribosomal protein L25